MNSIDSRLRKLEERACGSCSECSGGKGIITVWHDDPPPREHCPKCGRGLTIIRIVYDRNELEGGG